MAEAPSSPPRAAIPESTDNHMTLHSVPHTAALPTLAQQKADFTAEGSPPPGKVSTEVPATPDPVVYTATHPGTRVYGTIKLKHRPAARHP